MAATSPSLSGSFSLTSLVTDVAMELPNAFEPLLLEFHRRGTWADNGTTISIGSDGGCDLCVEVSTGHVLSIDPTGIMPVRFVNASVRRLADSILAYSEYRDIARYVVDPAVAIKLVEALRVRIAAIDPLAFATNETWWAVVLDLALEGFP